jgi:hypothetical protein
MSSQEDMKAVTGTTAAGLRAVATPRKKRSLFAATYELLVHASLLDPALVVLPLASLAWWLS